MNLLRRIWCALFHRRCHELQPFLMPVKPFGGWRRVCWRCGPKKKLRRYNGPVELFDDEWKRRTRDSALPPT